ncbi:MAG: PAS domain-containing protein [Arenimonas sp.]
MQLEDLYQKACALSQDCIKLLDLDCRILTINDGGLRALQYLSPDQVIGQEWFELWPERSRDKLRKLAENVKAGHVECFTDFCPTAAGEPRWWFVSVGPILDDNGEIRRLMVVSRDVTDRIELEGAFKAINATVPGRLEKASVDGTEASVRYQRLIQTLGQTQLKYDRAEADAAVLQQRVNLAQAAQQLAEDATLQARANEAIGQMAAGIAHDFNNMLQSIKLALGTLKERTELSPEKRARLLDIGLTAVDQAAASAKRLMNFGRAHVVASTPADLQSVVVSMTDFVAHSLGPQMHMDVQRIDGPLWAMIDVHAVEQVLINLFINARDACAGKGVIEIRFGESTVSNDSGACQTFATVSVSDNGPGMTEHVRSHLFEPYFTTKAEGRGSGLGLAQVYGLMLQLEGNVSVISELGRGTTFTLSFCKADV